MTKRKVIVTCAVTGSIHTPSMSPHLPVTAAEIANAAIGAAAAGAAIVHLHARDPADGRPDQSPERFRPFLELIKQQSNCVVNITTGGASTMTIEERLKPVAKFKPEVASLNMGSMNFGLYPMLERFQAFKHEWERPYLEGSRDLIFKNTFADIERILTTCAENGTRFEIECYDIGHLYTLAHFVDRKLVKPSLLHSERVRHPWRHRSPSRRRHAHAPHRRSPVWRRLSLVGAGSRTQPAPRRSAGGGSRRQHPCRSRGLIVDRPWTPCGLERRAGREGAPHHRGTGPGDRNVRGGSGNSATEGRRPGGLLIGSSFGCARGPIQR